VQIFAGQGDYWVYITNRIDKPKELDMAFRSHCAKPYKIVSNDDLEQIHNASLEVLERIGVKFADEGALHFLQDHGCDVNFESQVVKFPSELVETSLQDCPSSFTLQARNPQYNITFDATSVHFSACSGMAVLDIDTMQRRPPTLNDAEETARLCDALENIAGSNTGLGWLVDKPTETNLEWLYAAAIRNSEKVTSVGVMDNSESWGIRMAQAAGEDIIVAINSASPLGWTQDQITGARRALEASLPLGLQSMASMGVTAPATMAGTATVMNAEILAMAVLVQLLKPGTGLMYSCFTIPLDMRTTMLASGSIELGMLTALSAQLSKFYGMGSIAFLPMTDSKLPDQQAGYEKGLQWLLAGMSGINLIWGAGMLEGHTLWSNAQLVIDAEICGMVARSLDGIAIQDETFALDVIQEVGHFPASYLETDHTIKWWRSERYLPSISSRESFENWVEKGGKDILRQADEKARALLESHQFVPLSPEVDKEIDQLLKAAAKEKGVA
jgi:trimethylamine--corrinoid protein Co-methyltransferase